MSDHHEFREKEKEDRDDGHFIPKHSTPQTSGHGRSLSMIADDIIFLLIGFPFASRVNLELRSLLRLSGQKRKHFAVNYPTRLPLTEKRFCLRKEAPNDEKLNLH